MNGAERNPNEANTMTDRQARKLAEKRFGTHPLWGFQYSEGSRTVGDMIATIIKNDCDGEEGEAAFWRGELNTLVPQFDEMV